MWARNLFNLNKYLVILSPLGAFRDNETNNSKRRWKGYESQQLGGEPVAYFTNVAQDLNPGQQRTNPASSQGGIWTWGLRITSPVL